jgi:hypothetical protein
VAHEWFHRRLEDYAVGAVRAERSIERKVRMLHVSTLQIRVKKTVVQNDAVLLEKDGVEVPEALFGAEDRPYAREHAGAALIQIDAARHVLPAEIGDAIHKGGAVGKPQRILVEHLAVALLLLASLLFILRRRFPSPRAFILRRYISRAWRRSRRFLAPRFLSPYRLPVIALPRLMPRGVVAIGGGGTSAMSAVFRSGKRPCSSHRLGLNLWRAHRR